jgi:hypothetical protein
VIHDKYQTKSVAIDFLELINFPLNTYSAALATIQEVLVGSFYSQK